MSSELENQLWTIISSYFSKYGVVRHQLESYNNFMCTVLPHIIQESSEINIGTGPNRHIVTLCNVSVQKPMLQESDGYDRPIMPHIARIRGATYAASVLVDATHDIYKDDILHERRVFREILFCKIPVMVGSLLCYTSNCENNEECKLDQGGYFIVNGIEKVLMAQEKLLTNVPFIFKLKQPARFQLICEIRSCHELKMRSTSTLYIYVTNIKKGSVPEMVCELPFIDMHVPVLALFKLLGVNTRAEVIDMIYGIETLESSESRLLSGILDNDASCDMSHEDILEWLGREGTKETSKERRLRYIDHIISNEILPHMGLTQEPDVQRKKALFLGFMIRKILRAYKGEIQCDDRDHYANKRMDTAGHLMSLLCRQIYRPFLRTFSTQLIKLHEANKLQYTNIGDMINHKKVTGAFKYAFSTGNWGVQKQQSSQQGVAQMMSRMTSVAALSNLRRINTPINREGKTPKPRQLHYTSWGIVCPAETPEGTSCGLIKNLAMMAHVRIGTHSGAIKEHIDLMQPMIVLLLDCSNEIRSNGIPVFINGILYAYLRNVQDVQTTKSILRNKKSNMEIPFDASIATVDGALYIHTDAGCLCRPLILANQLENIDAILSKAPPFEFLWDYLINEKLIEYVDKQEEGELLVGLDTKYPDPKYSHYELHPSLINGLCASLIPFCDHNQAPRNCYQSAMGKQAIGIYSTAYPMRMDTISHTLIHPQRPLVCTRIENVLKLEQTPTGMNAITVIMCYGGFNQEDSLIINQDAILRGLFKSIKYQTYRDEERTNGADSEKFEKPSECTGLKIGCYDKIQEDGMPMIGASITNNDIIIGKTITTTEIGEGTRRSMKRDRCVLAKNIDTSIIDAIVKSKNRDGSILAKIRTRSTRTPMVGDKLSSRHGQKGVIGMVLPACDMPFTKDGLVPDIIINPHAIPSRMTIGQLIECLLGKLGCITGEIGDGTPFRGTSIEQIGDMLEQHGHDRNGNETMYNGITGQKLKAQVFIGPTYYQRLKHLVLDKHHARSRGPIQILTRQPVEGRAREGGLRLGEMERDCFISHGVANLLRERLVEQSDAFIAPVCGTCGMLAQPKCENSHLRDKVALCRNCGDKATVYDIRMPYAFKLLLQELNAMNIAVRLKLKHAHSETLCESIQLNNVVYPYDKQNSDSS